MVQGIVELAYRTLNNWLLKTKQRSESELDHCYLQLNKVPVHPQRSFYPVVFQLSRLCFSSRPVNTCFQKAYSSPPAKAGGRNSSIWRSIFSTYCDFGLIWEQGVLWGLISQWWATRFRNYINLRQRYMPRGCGLLIIHHRTMFVQNKHKQAAYILLDG